MWSGYESPKHVFSLCTVSLTSLGIQGSHETVLNWVTLGNKPVTASGSRVGGYMGRNREARGRKYYVRPRTLGAGGKRINHNNECRKHFENKVLNT